MRALPPSSAKSRPSGSRLSGCFEGGAQWAETNLTAPEQVLYTLVLTVPMLIGTERLLKRGADRFNLAVGEMFNPNKFVAGIMHGTDQFIELRLHRSRIAVLRILDKEYHQKRCDSRPGIDHQLPCVRPIEKRATRAPTCDDENRHDKGGGLARRKGGPRCDDGEKAVHKPMSPCSRARAGLTLQPFLIAAGEQRNHGTRIRIR